MDDLKSAKQTTSNVKNRIELGKLIYTEEEDNTRKRILARDKIKYLLEGSFLILLGFVSLITITKIIELPILLFIFSILVLIFVVFSLEYFGINIIIQGLCLGNITLFDFGLYLPETRKRDYIRKNKTTILYDDIVEIYFGTATGSPGIVLLLSNGEKIQIYKHDIVDIQFVEQILHVKNKNFLYDNYYLSPGIGDSIRTNVVYVPKNGIIIPSRK